MEFQFFCICPSDDMEAPDPVSVKT